MLSASISYRNHRQKWNTKYSIHRLCVPFSNYDNIYSFVAPTPIVHATTSEFRFGCTEIPFEETQSLYLIHYHRARVHSRPPSATHRTWTFPEKSCTLVRVRSQGRYYWAARKHPATFYKALLATHSTPTRWQTQNPSNPTKQPALDNLDKNATLVNHPFCRIHSTQPRTARQKSAWAITQNSVKIEVGFSSNLTHLFQRYLFPYSWEKKDQWDNTRAMCYWNSHKHITKPKVSTIYCFKDHKNKNQKQWNLQSSLSDNFSANTHYSRHNLDRPIPLGPPVSPVLELRNLF